MRAAEKVYWWNRHIEEMEQAFEESLHNQPDNHVSFFESAQRQNRLEPPKDDAEQLKITGW